MDLRADGWLDSHASAKPAPEASRGQRPWARLGSSALAERILYTTGPFLPGACPCRGASVPLGATHRKAGCGRSASPVWREGERANPLSLPLFSTRFPSDCRPCDTFFALSP